MLKFTIATIVLDYELNIDTNDLDNAVRCRVAICQTGGLVSRANPAGANHSSLLFAAPSHGSGGLMVGGHRLAFVSVYLAGRGQHCFCHVLPLDSWRTIQV